MTRPARNLLLLLLLQPLLALGQSEHLLLVGQAQLKFLLWPIYDSRLYSTDGSYRDRQRPLRLEIQYLRDIDANDLVARTGAEWQQQSVPVNKQERWLQTLSDLWPDVSKNDVLTLHIDLNDQSTFYRNGSRLGAIDDPEFGQHFLDIWLSPETSRPELRQALLGQQ
ncbi:MAG: chalcone isomerase family protein [Halioglobus sp.]